jgi:hypothetical protein
LFIPGAWNPVGENWGEVLPLAKIRRSTVDKAILDPR